MEIVIAEKAIKDIEFWRKQNNKKALERISKLKNSIIKNPFRGLGKPEPLKYNFSGKWSRRIDKENRFIYAIKDKKLFIYSLKGHYYET